LNYKENKKKIFYILLILLILSFFWDEGLFFLFQKIRISFFDSFMLFVTDYGLPLATVFLSLYLINKKNWAGLILIVFCPIAMFYFSFLLKPLFEVPRPFQNFDIKPLEIANLYSFPSMHASYAFGLYYAFTRIFKKNIRLFWFISLLFAFSRVYVGVHYISDIFGGIIIGYFGAKIIFEINEKYTLTDRLIRNFQTRLEFRRQFLHLAVGLSIVFLLEFEIINLETLLILLIIGCLLSIISKKARLPVVNKYLMLFDREKDIYSFPGKGCIYLIFGAFLSVALFPINIAMAGITIMAFGDSLSVIVGKFYGKIPHPFNRNRKIEGLLAAVASSTFGACFFVPFYQAFLASFIAMFLESFTIKIHGFEIDDNLIVPVVACSVLLLM
jgi:dolichol kinase